MKNPPTELYSDGLVLVPPHLGAAYEAELTARGLLDKAKAKSPSDVIGGASKDESELHFTFRFSASAVRGENSILDPVDQLGEIPSDLLATFQDGKISCLDVAAGTGGGTLGLLLCVQRLRELGIVASAPLEVRILAGDISEFALDIYRSLLDRLRPALESVGIRVQATFQVWDIKAAAQVAGIVDQWFGLQPDAEEHLVLVSAITGAGKELLDASRRTFQHIGERLAQRKSTILWIEPNMTSAPLLVTWVLGKLNLDWFKPTIGTGRGYSYKWVHPITSSQLGGSILIYKYQRV